MARIGVALLVKEDIKVGSRWR